MSKGNLIGVVAMRDAEGNFGPSTPIYDSDVQPGDARGEVRLEDAAVDAISRWVYSQLKKQLREGQDKQEANNETNA